MTLTITGTGTAFGRTRSSASYDGNIDDNGDYNGNGDGNDDGEIRVLLKRWMFAGIYKICCWVGVYSEVMCIFVL